MAKIIIGFGVTKVFKNHKLVNKHYSTVSDKKYYSDKGFTVIMAR